MATPNVTKIAAASGIAALIVVDVSGRIRFLNLAATQMLGYTLEEVGGRLWTECVDVIEQSTRKLLPDAVEACLIANQVTPLADCAVLISAQGAEVAVEGSVSPFCWYGDEVFAAVVALRGADPVAGPTSLQFRSPVTVPAAPAEAADWITGPGTATKHHS